MISKKISTYTFIYSLLLLFFYTPSVKGQDYSKDAENLFNNYLNEKKFYSFIVQSTPTIDECKYIFNGNDAYSVYGFMQEMRNNIEENLDIKDDGSYRQFDSVEVKSFTSQIIIDKNLTVSKHIQKNVMFYNVTFLIDGNKIWSNIIFTNIKGRWVITPLDEIRHVFK